MKGNSEIIGAINVATNRDQIINDNDFNPSAQGAPVEDKQNHTTTPTTTATTQQSPTRLARDRKKSSSLKRLSNSFRISLHMRQSATSNGDNNESTEPTERNAEDPYKRSAISQNRKSKQKTKYVSLEEIETVRENYKQIVEGLNNEVTKQREQISGYHELLELFGDSQALESKLQAENESLKQDVSYQQTSYEEKLLTVQDELEDIAEKSKKHELEIKEKKSLEKEVAKMMSELKQLTDTISLQQENYGRQLDLVQDQVQEMSKIVKDQKEELRDTTSLTLQIKDLRVQLASSMSKEEIQNNRIEAIKEERDLLRDESMRGSFACRNNNAQSSTSDRSICTDTSGLIREASRRLGS